jgi:hypothetical protein
MGQSVEERDVMLLDLFRGEDCGDLVDRFCGL